MRILLVGGAGFIGTNFTKYIFERNTDDYVVNLSTTTNPTNNRNVNLFSDNPNYQHIEGRIEDTEALRKAFMEKIDVIVNFAGKTNVDMSIRDPKAYIFDNLLGTQMLVEFAHQYKVSRFIQISSVEVYGEIERNQDVFETNVLSPINPYAVSKACSDLLALSYHKSKGLDVVIARCTNNYGPFQQPDKFIPKVITNALKGEKIPLYGEGLLVRDWLHVYDHCSALYTIMQQATEGSIYNISGNNLASTYEIIDEVLQLTGRSWSLIERVPERAGDHDRYAPRCDKLRSELDWKPKYDLSSGLIETVEWYRQNSPTMVGGFH